MRKGEEVGWHERLFQALCHMVVSDVQAYQSRHSGTSMSELPHPTVLVVMPLSRSAIPLSVLLQEACNYKGIPTGVVQVSLPLSIRGESVPIVHCVRHRRTLRAQDQYAGTQQNLNQEYINLTRGVEKTCMWLEEQPFGVPHRTCKSPIGVRIDARCIRYALTRNEYILDSDLTWYHLREHGYRSWFFWCFEKELTVDEEARVRQLSLQIWNDLKYGKRKELPNLGQGPSDFKCLDEVLTQAVGTGTDVSQFAGEGTQTLRAVGHGSAAARYRVNDVHEKVNLEPEVFEWKPAMQFGHLLLPCATAEISSQSDKGLTRLCLPFLQVSDGHDPEDAIASLCGLTWYLAYHVAHDLVVTARLHRVAHKMRITKEDGDLWFNKACKSSRIATAIKENNNSVLYMYLGGGCVAHEQSYLLGGVVVNCKDWRWAALVYAAARIAGIACNNPLGPLDADLVILMDGEDGEAAMATRHEFQSLCQSIYDTVNDKCYNDALVELSPQNRYKYTWRQLQSGAVGAQLVRQRQAHEAKVKAFLAKSHVDG